MADPRFGAAGAGAGVGVGVGLVVVAGCVSGDGRVKEFFRALAENFRKPGSRPPPALPPNITHFPTKNKGVVAGATGVEGTSVSAALRVIRAAAGRG